MLSYSRRLDFSLLLFLKTKHQKKKKKKKRFDIFTSCEIQIKKKLSRPWKRNFVEDKAKIIKKKQKRKQNEKINQIMMGQSHMRTYLFQTN